MKKKSLFFTSVAMLGLTAATMAQNVPSYVPTNGLAGWWPFNGNANDESGNNNNGIVNGATMTTDRFGNANKAYNFNGISSYIEVPNANNLQLTNNYSICGWFNANIFFLTNTNDRRLISKVQSTGWYGGYEIFIGGSTNDIAHTGNVGGNNFVLGSQGYSINNWYMFTVTYEGTTQKLFMNGVLVNSQPNTGSLQTSNLPLLFGKIGGNSGYFDGILDDLGIWNRALTQQEISDLYNAVNCSNSLSITPQTNLLQTGSIANFTATTSDPNPTYIWQSDLGQGFQTLNNYGKYSGTNTNTLTITNVQLPNHTQQVRAISTSGNCIDTSNTAAISITDTCINTVNDTNFITVTDTLLINALITSVQPSINNLIRVYPNPAISHLYIDNGNYLSMSGYSIRIDNSLGQQVFQSAINQQQFFVDLSTWSGNGLYFLHLINPQGQSIDVRKIVIQ
ncbi:MAG: LamG-like jellyroll fold domain-containing protein [Bacteroidota bacterium]|jgi:hypothetical protein